MNYLYASSSSGVPTTTGGTPNRTSTTTTAVIGGGVRITTRTSPGGLRELSYTCTQLLQECNIHYGTGLPGLNDRTWIPDNLQFSAHYTAQLSRTLRNFTTLVHGDYDAAAAVNCAEQQIRRTMTNFSTLLHEDEDEDEDEDEEEEQQEEEEEEQCNGLPAIKEETGVHDENDVEDTAHNSKPPRRTHPAQQHPKKTKKKKAKEEQEQDCSSDLIAHSSNPGSYDMC